MEKIANDYLNAGVEGSIESRGGDYSSRGAEILDKANQKIFGAVRKTDEWLGDAGERQENARFEREVHDYVRDEAVLEEANTAKRKKFDRWAKRKTLGARLAGAAGTVKDALRSDNKIAGGESDSEDVLAKRAQLYSAADDSLSGKAEEIRSKRQNFEDGLRSKEEEFYGQFTEEVKTAGTQFVSENAGYAGNFAKRLLSRAADMAKKVWSSAVATGAKIANIPALYAQEKTLKGLEKVRERDVRREIAGVEDERADVANWAGMAVEDVDDKIGAVEARYRAVSADLMHLETQKILLETQLDNAGERAGVISAQVRSIGKEMQALRAEMDGLMYGRGTILMRQSDRLRDVALENEVDYARRIDRQNTMAEREAQERAGYVADLQQKRRGFQEDLVRPFGNLAQKGKDWFSERRARVDEASHDADGSQVNVVEQVKTEGEN
jgi:hypothetical protein